MHAMWHAIYDASVVDVSLCIVFSHILLVGIGVIYAMIMIMISLVIVW